MGLYILASLVGASADLAVNVDRNLSVTRDPAELYAAALVVLSFAVYFLMSLLLAGLFSFLASVRRSANAPLIVVALTAAVPQAFFIVQRSVPLTAVFSVAVLTALVIGVPLVVVSLVKLSVGKKTGVATAFVLGALFVSTQVFFAYPRFFHGGYTEKPNVLLITIDTVRADHIGVYGYDTARQPNITALGDRGVVVPYATCEVPITAPSHATMMTSLPAASHGILLNVMYLRDVPVLAEYFSDAGYTTAAFLGGSPLWDRDTGLGRGFDLYDDAMSPVEDFEPTPFMNGRLAGVLGFLRDDDKPLERNADEVTDAVVRGLGREAKQPFFIWVHYFDAHDEYLPPAEFAPAGLGDKKEQRDLNERWSADEDPPPGDTGKIIALYDGEIEFVDYELGRLLDYLKDAGGLENTVVCLVSDHGEGLLDHDTKYHGLRVYREDVLIPLVFSGYGYDVPALQVDAGYPVTTLDVAATLLDLAGLPVPARMRGRSLFSPGPDRDFGYSFTLPDPKRGTPEGRGRLDTLYGNGYKIIVSSRGTVELYDLTNDPGETTNLADINPGVTAEMKKALDDYVATLPTADVGPRDIDAERVEMLKDLGYLQ